MIVPHRVRDQRLGAEAFGDRGQVEVAAVDHIGRFAARGGDLAQAVPRQVAARCPPRPAAPGSSEDRYWRSRRPPACSRVDSSNGRPGAAPVDWPLAARGPEGPGL